MKQKTLAVIGASYLQMPLVVKAKSMGLRVIAFAWEKGAVCAPHCDRFYPISIIEKEKILEVCKQEKIDGVTSIASDVAVPTIAYVSSKMGLTGNTCESAQLCTDKYMMRKALVCASLPCPKFIRAESVEEVVARLKEAQLRYPLIVKPTDRSGSLCVSRVKSDSELMNSVHLALEVSLSHAVIIEEFIEQAREVSIEGISWNDKYHPLVATDKVTTGVPHFVEVEHHQPANMSESMKNKLFDIVAKAASVLKIKMGASHAEFMITPNEQVYITEIGARMGGAFIGSHLVKLSTGYDFVRAVIECSLGSFQAPRLPLDVRHHSGVFFACEGRTDVETFIKRCDYGDDVVDARFDGDKPTHSLSCNADRYAHVIYQGSQRPASVNDLKRK